MLNQILRLLEDAEHKATGLNLLQVIKARNGRRRPDEPAHVLPVGTETIRVRLGVQEVFAAKPVEKIRSIPPYSRQCGRRKQNAHFTRKDQPGSGEVFRRTLLHEFECQVRVIEDDEGLS